MHEVCSDTTSLITLLAFCHRKVPGGGGGDNKRLSLKLTIVPIVFSFGFLKILGRGKVV